jgi:hypothetical protein
MRRDKMRRESDARFRRMGLVKTKGRHPEMSKAERQEYYRRYSEALRRLNSGC